MIGENFPYTNFHDLNLDWIIKIAKDFLDQYTNIQDLITQGEADITSLTEESISGLQDKYDTLEGLLQSWYNEHSEDIAEQLASALQDISDQLTSAISSFNESATAKGEQVLESIPDDYTEITEQIDNVENLLVLSNSQSQYLLDFNYYTIEDTLIANTGSGTSVVSGYSTTPYIPVYSPYMSVTGEAFPLEAYNSFVLYDADYTVLYRAHGSFSVKVQDYPTAKYFRASNNNVGTYNIYISNNQYQYIADMMCMFTDNAELPDSLLIYENKLMQGDGTSISNISGYYLSDYIPILSKNIHFYGNFFPMTAYTTFVLYDDTFTPVYIANGTQHINLESYPTATYFRYGGNMVNLHTYIGVGTENIQFDIGSDQFYTTLKDGIKNAIKFKNSKVLVHPGTYDLATEFASEISEASGSSGILLANGVYIAFSAGSYVKALFPVSNDYISTYFQPFRGYNFTLDGLNIESSNCRYCVHDEQASGNYVYHNVYKNCIMKHSASTSSGSSSAYIQCIGGGLGKHGYIEIIGGVYESHGDMTDATAISYHNGGVAECDNRIFISNVYLKDHCYFQFSSWGTHSKKSQVIVNNCSMPLAIVEDTIEVGGQDNIELIEYNNTIR